jgi:hypothetical protein
MPELKYLDYPTDALERVDELGYIAPTEDEAREYFRANGCLVDRLSVWRDDSGKPFAFRAVTSDSWEEWKASRDHRPEAIAKFLCEFLTKRPEYLLPGFLAHYIENGVSDRDEHIPFVKPQKEAENVGQTS